MQSYVKNQLNSIIICIFAANPTKRDFVQNPIVKPKALDKSSQDPLKRQGIIIMAKKDTSKYELYDGHKMVYAGTTTDPKRREAEHRASGKDFTKMTIIGRPSTKEGASKWEAERIATYKRNHNGERPKYNRNDSGK